MPPAPAHYRGRPPPSAREGRPPRPSFPSKEVPMIRTLTVAVAVLTVAATGPAQEPKQQPKQQFKGRGGPAPLVSPEVKPDRTVTFRLRAPRATEVVVGGDGPVNRKSMTKDERG